MRLALLVVALVAVLAAPAGAADAPTVDLVVGTVEGELVHREVPASAAPAAIDVLEADPDIAFAEVDVPVEAVAFEPDDRYFRYQWGPVLTGATTVWAEPAGDTTRDVVIAVIDTGVDADHPDLDGAVLPGLDLIRGGTDDPNGHGTAVAGVIAARGDNGIGVAGFCWTCSILPVRALEADGTGTGSTVAQGVRWAAEQGADVINLSLAGTQESQALASAISDARSRGAAVVAAAGNDGTTAPRYPAASADVLGVVATDEVDAVYDWASRGSWADVAAPGCALTTDAGGHYDDVCGSSLASPAVAGAIGLALSSDPDATPSEVEAALLATGVPVGALVAPAGRVDVATLVDVLGDDPEDPGPVTPQVERVAGADRIATAAAVAQRTHATAESVVIARADQPADALLAAPLAGQHGAPVLLTTGDRLAPVAAAEIERLGATEAWIVGGTAAVETAVEDGLRRAGIGSIHRYEGESRVETAAAIARSIGSDRAFVTSASAWADAVAVSPLAAQQRAPILLVGAAQVPDATRQAIADLGITELTVVGGEGVIDAEAITRLESTGAAVRRIAGATRYATSAALAVEAVAQGADPAGLWLATGAAWPDALTSGPAAAAAGQVLLLVPGQAPETMPELSAWLQRHAAATFVVVGGEASVGDPLVASLHAA